MSALTAPRNTPAQGSAAVIPLLSWPMAASTICYEGGIVVAASGYAAPGSTATGLSALGIALKTADNSAGSNGTISVQVNRGCFQFKNSSSGDLIAQANLPCTVYIVDDQTVALTDGSGTRSAAGRAVAVDGNGVWVEIGMHGL